MAGITLEIAEAKLTAYLNAETAVLGGQKYVIDGVELSRANLADIQKGITLWNARASRLGRSGGGLIVREVNPR